jgi:hypothetical protein
MSGGSRVFVAEPERYLLAGLLSHGEELDWGALAVVTTSEPNLPSQGHVLSWDSFHFEDESLFGSQRLLP